MEKYGFEFKKKIVQEYLDGKGGYGNLAIKYEVASTADVINWFRSDLKFEN